MKHFPSKLPKGRVPDREYFWNVMHTLMPEYTQALMAHANEQRNSQASEAQAKETIEITDEWYEKLKAVPFMSCKSPTPAYYESQRCQRRPCHSAHFFLTQPLYS